jgi:hypothetical protein
MYNNFVTFVDSSLFYIKFSFYLIAFNCYPYICTINNLLIFYSLQINPHHYLKNSYFTISSSLPHVFKATYLYNKKNQLIIDDYL